jgi:hypothetical protein
LKGKWGYFLVKCRRMVMMIFGMAISLNRKLVDGRKSEPMDSANRAKMISQGKCLVYEYPITE